MPKKKATREPPMENPTYSLQDLEDREDRLITLATNLAEQQLLDGTATSQVICHYLKLGSTKEKLEKRLLEKQIGFTSAKTRVLENPNTESEKYEEAIAAMKKYCGE